MSHTTIEKSCVLNAPPETVWAFLTDKTKLGAWYHFAEADLEEGKEYRLYKLDEAGNKTLLVTGRVLDYAFPRKLVTTFVIQPFAGRESIVTWLLNPVDMGTSLTLKHEGIDEAAGDAAAQLFEALEKGWQEHLNRLMGATTT